MIEPDVLGIAAAPISSLDAEAVKGCCASAYASEAARWLLGEHFHPGGAALTSQLARALEVVHDTAPWLMLRVDEAQARSNLPRSIGVR